MDYTHYPYATQDWSLNKGRALQLEAAQVRAVESLNGGLWITVSGSAQDFFLNAGETLSIPCSHGQVVVEPVTAAATARVALIAQSPLVANVSPTFWQAASVSLLHPLAVALRVVADWLDPKFARA
jgi:Protein of unknown function (DUF2917)